MIKIASETREQAVLEPSTQPSAVAVAEPPTTAAQSLAARVAAFRADCLMHAWTYRDASYVADPVTGVTFRIGAEAIAAAKAIESVALGDDLARALDAAGIEQATTLLADLERLRKEGLFLRSRLSLEKIHAATVRAFLRHHPRKMMLLVAQTCNLRCVYCYAIEGNFHDEGKLMTLETAQQSIEFLAKRSGPRKKITVTLFGGEPLLNFAMIRQLVPWSREHLRKLGKSIHYCITTNGTLLTDEIIDFLIAEQFSLMISFDGPKEAQDLSRPNAGGMGSFDVAAPRIRRLLEKHPHRETIMVRATMTHQNHDALRLAKFFEEFGFSRIALGMNVGFSFYKGSHDMTAEDRQRVFQSSETLLDSHALDAIRNYRRLKYNPVLQGLLGMHEDRESVGPKAKISCGVGRNDEGVGVDGKVYPCHRYVGMPAYVIGDIWNGVSEESVGRYYRSVLDVYKHCAGCWATHWCSGMCPQYLSDPTGKVIGPDAPACDSVRKNLQRNLALYTQLSDEGVDWERAKTEASNP